jgi:hypothetical protein
MTQVLLLAAHGVRVSIDSTLIENRGRREDRVPFAPMVRVQQKSTRQNHRYEPNNRPSLRNGFNGLLRALPGETGLCCHRPCDARSVVTSATMRKRIAREAPASGRQDHTTSPSAICCSSHNTPRPSHPASNVRDDREAPLMWRRDARKCRCDLPDNASEKCARRAVYAWAYALLSPPSLRAHATCPPKPKGRRRKQSRLSPLRQSGLLRRFAPRNNGLSSPRSFRGTRSVNPESRDSGFGPNGPPRNDGRRNS